MPCTINVHTHTHTHTHTEKRDGKNKSYMVTYSVNNITVVKTIFSLNILLAQIHSMQFTSLNEIIIIIIIINNNSNS